jgi:HD-like signal output (HDOD) protein
MGGARPPRPAVVGLSESDLVTLYSTGAVRAIPKDETLVPAAGACYFVVEGPLELRVGTNGHSVPLGTVSRGECVEAGVDAVPYTIIAREAASVIELSGAALDLLPVTTQRTLGRIAAASSARCFNALAARHAAAAGRSAGLASAVRDGAVRAKRVLAMPPLREALAQIPALPVPALGLASRILDDRTHADEIVESIKNDPALASLVLKRVNSAHYGLETKVSDHYRALLLLGTATVYQLILESAVESVIPDMPESRDIQARATLASVLAYEVALASGRVPPLLASTIGLLHNIGDSIALLIRRSRPEAAVWLDCVESPALGAAVLTGWGLPERVCEVVGRQDQPRVLHFDELGAHAPELAVLYVARVCHDVLLEKATPPENVAEHLAGLGIRETSCAAFCRDVIVPALAKKAEALPASVRARLQG